MSEQMCSEALSGPDMMIDERDAVNTLNKSRRLGSWHRHLKLLAIRFCRSAGFTAGRKTWN